MQYDIKALSLIDRDELAEKLVAANVCRDVNAAKNTIRTWKTKRGYVSTDGERVIRSILEERGECVTVADFWDPDVWREMPNKHGVPP